MSPDSSTRSLPEIDHYDTALMLCGMGVIDVLSPIIFKIRLCFADNEPIEFGDQFFWDYTNKDAADYFINSVSLGGLKQPFPLLNL